MYGAILGDIIGSPFEFDRGDKTKEFDLFSKDCDFTDDSVMTIAVGEALLAVRPKAAVKEIEDAVASNMQDLGKRYPHAGYGGSFRHWLKENNPKPYGSYGNGSAMRVSAAGWLYDSIERTREVARATANVTHNHPEGIKGAEATASAIYMARNGFSKEEIKEYIGTQLKALTSIASPTGFTKNATDYLMKQLEAMGYAPQLSNKGNVSVEIGGEGAPLVLAAHVDTLGAMVRSIKDNGRLRPTTIGGHQWSTADGENCMVFTRDGRMYTGVVLNTEPSAHVADEKVEIKEENMEILLDENVNDKQGVAALGIQTGDIIAMDPRTVITESGYIKSRFLDDKLSAAILLGVAHAVKEEGWKINRKVTLLFTVYEEVGHGGSFVPADTEEMISVDMGCVGADLGCTEHMVSICAKDSGGPYNYELVTELSNLAKSEGLDYAIDVYPHYGSDVEATLHSGYDIRHGLIGAGVYASHNYERSHMDGVENTYKLLKKYITK